MRHYLAGACLMLLATAPLAGWRVQSGPQRTLMVELFTSQGCNSCPPAEALLNRFSTNPRLWQRFVPLAFHVDYWDALGWKDRYALPANAQRQRRYAQLGHLRGVYTPGFVVNGRGWRPGWFRSEPPATGQAAGVLDVSLEGRRVTARYDAAAGQAGALRFHLAVLGMGLATDIRAGENAGRHSRHQFVVLDHRQLAGEGPRWTGDLPKVRDAGQERLAVAFWVARPGDPTPLQAAGGYLPAVLD